MRLLIYIMLALAPLPFGSARPVWQWFWVVMVALAALVHLMQSRWAARYAPPRMIRVALLMAALFVAWGYLQASPLINTGLQIADPSSHPLAPQLLASRVDALQTVAVATYFLSHLLFFYLVFALCTNGDNAVHLARFCGLVVTAYALYGFIVYVSGNETVLWFAKTENPGSRSLTSSFINRNNFAAFAGLGLQCLVAYATFFMRRLFGGESEHAANFRFILEALVIKAWWPALATAFTAMALLLSQSRGGVASVAIGLLLMMMLTTAPWRGEGRKIRAALGLAVFLVSAVGLISISGGKLETRLATAGVSSNMRLDFYPLVVDAIADKPLTGSGLGTFSEVFPVYRTVAVPKTLVRAHSEYLELALTAGLPAALILLVACSLPVVLLLKRLKYAGEHRIFIVLGISSSLQIGLHALVDFPLQIPAVSYLMCAILAASVALASRPLRQ